MKFHKAYKYRLYPTPEQQVRLHQWFAAVRMIYNAALEQRSLYGARKIDFVRRGERPLYSAYSQAKELPFRELSKDPEISWITDIPKDAVSYALSELDEAFKKFFAGSGYPTFRNAVNNNSVCFKTHINNKPSTVFGKDSVSFPKIGRIRYVKHIRHYGKMRRATIVKEGDQYFVVLVTEHEREARDNGGEELGVDLGIKRPVTLSTGEYVPADAGLKELIRKKDEAQRKLSGQKKGSKRRQKQKDRLRKIHQRIARRRAARTHQITTEIVRRAKKVVIEDLKVQNMTRSAKGTMENPGKNVAQKSGLNRENLNVGYYEYRRQLAYKCPKHGTELVIIPAPYTSQRCSSCGAVDPASRNRKIDDFICTSCGHTQNADHNAARNILFLGTSGDVANPRKTRKPGKVSGKSPLNTIVRHSMSGKSAFKSGTCPDIYSGVT